MVGGFGIEENMDSSALESALVDCNNFLGKTTIAGSQVTVTAVSIATGLVTVTSRPTVYSIVGSINKRTALPEAVPAAPSVLPRMPDGYRVYNPGATEYVAPTAKVKRQWGNNVWGDQWDRFSPDNSWTGIPRYASACASRSEYANACYRYGATGGSVVGGSEMVTVTVTQMVQATTTITVPVTSAG
ncbi:MAG: hypothetical protein M1839_004574 [Geoglossum umbratile]|nr:MAG: hypothetical protein M1839_004574 [Geoglossum umbratile]